MTVLTLSEDSLQAFETCTPPVRDNDSMQVVLSAIHRDLSLDPTKTEKQVRKRMSDLVVAANHMAKSLKTTWDRLTVSQAVENEEGFLDYISRSKLSPASKNQLPANRNAVLRYARKFGFSPASFTLLDEWDRVLALLTSEHGAMAVAKDAIRRKRRPIDFSNADLAVWADATLIAGRTYSYARNAQAAFLTAIRRSGLQSHFPLLDVAVRKPQTFKLRMTEMVEPLRDEITRIIESRRNQATLGAIGMAPATETEIVEHFEDLCGYAARVCGMENLVSLRPLLTEAFIKQFAFWMRKERMCKRTTVVGRLSRMVSSLATSPDFADLDFGWIYNVYRKLRPEPESALKERRRQRHIEFQELVAIPGRMYSDRTALQGLSPESLGWRVHDELLLSVLILAQWSPRFVRLAELGRDVFKGPIPKDGPPFSVSSWAREALCEDPNAQFWQFHYKSLTGELHRGLVLRGIVPLLELYVEKFRRRLVRPHNVKHLFCNRSGHVLSCSSLGNLVSSRLWRYVRKRVTLTSIRSSFAYYWRDKYANNKDAVLSQIQWVDYATTKMRYDEEFRKQRALRVYRRKNRYA